MIPLHSPRGFSLIEVMIVLVIIGIASAAVSLSVAPDPKELLRRDARELALRLESAQREARVDGRVIVWSVREEGYEFLRGTWTTLPGHVVPSVTTAGQLDRFERDDFLRPSHWRSGKVKVHPAGPLLLTSEWVGAPLDIELSLADQTVVVRRDGRGQFLVQ